MSSSAPGQLIVVRLRILLFYLQALTGFAILPMLVDGGIASLQCLAPHRDWSSVHHYASYYGRDRDHGPRLLDAKFAHDRKPMDNAGDKFQE